MKSYKDFYLKAMGMHTHGFKLTLGGTGLGKTHGMREAIREHFETNPKGARVIYTTYRHQLVEEVSGKLKAEGVTVRYLKADGDIIQELIQTDKLMDIVERLASEGLFKGDLLLEDPGYRSRDFDRKLSAIKSRMSLLKTAEKSNRELIAPIQDELNNHCRDLMNVFKNQLKRLGKSSPGRRDQFLRNADIWILFPYVALEHDEKSTVLVATIHKLLHGFFDGRQNIKLGSIQGKLIFLDEFDFLESTILDVMTNEPNLNNPIEFVRFFFEDFDYWLAQPFWEASPERQKMRERLAGVRKWIADELEKEKIDFPKIRHFRVEGKPFGDKNEVRLFQTNKLVVTRPFWLEEIDSSWYVRAQAPLQNIQPHALLRTFSRAKDRLLRAFQIFYQYPTHIEDIVSFVWNSKNDGQSGVYEKYIKENLAYYRGTGRRKDELGLNPKTFQTGYDTGFRLFKMRVGHLSIDPQGVHLEQLELLSSPEALIGKLSDENLVFGLSATADLPRLVKCFNLKWLSRNALVLPFDLEDYQLVARLKEKKAQSRKSTVKLVALDDLQVVTGLGDKLNLLETIGFFQHEGEMSSKSTPYRKDRVAEALKCLTWIAHHSEKSSHLMFLSTFLHLRQLLTGEGLSAEAKAAWNGVMGTEPIGQVGYRINLGGKSIAVAFLNAASSRNMSDEEYLRQYKALFQEEKFVLITQYQSASNGVNLLCLDQSGEKVDFGGVHLIDAQHFWLPKLEGKRFEQPEEKQMIWYLWKLLDQNVDFSEGRFRACLDTDHFHKVNEEYKKMQDYTLNQVALFHQSIGRIERERMETGLVEVSVGNVVFAELYKYLTDPAFLQIRQERKDTTSTLIDLIHAALLQHRPQRASVHSQALVQAQAYAKQSVELLLEGLRLVRLGGGSAQDRAEIRSAWEAVRLAVLRHEFVGKWSLPLSGGQAAEIDLSLLAVDLDSRFDLRTLHLDHDSTQLFSGKQSGLQHWELDAPFGAGRQAIVQDAFSMRGIPNSAFETASVKRQVWAPYIYQSVLKGRWGEQVIGALFSYHHIKLEPDADMPDELYELTDFKLEGHPIFIDCKHYSAGTQWQFGLGPADPGYDPAFDSRGFLLALQKRLRMIRDHAQMGSAAQIFVINVASLSTVPPVFLDENLRPVSDLASCAIGVVHSALDVDAGYAVSASFQNLVHYFQSLS